VTSFSGEGPKGVVVRHLKRFDERYVSDVVQRIAALEPEHFTRAGAAICHATAGLMKQPARHRLLLLLSDDKPNDVDQYDGRYGAEDRRQAINEAKLQGVLRFAWRSIAMPLRICRVFGVHQYALLTRPDRLPIVLLDWLKRLLASCVRNSLARNRREVRVAGGSGEQGRVRGRCSIGEIDRRLAHVLPQLARLVGGGAHRLQPELVLGCPRINESRR